MTSTFQLNFLQAILATIMITAGSIGELIEAYSAASFFFHMLVFVALLIMRVTHAKEPRFFKVCICTLAWCSVYTRDIGHCVDLMILVSFARVA